METLCHKMSDKTGPEFQVSLKVKVESQGSKSSLKLFSIKFVAGVRLESKSCDACPHLWVIAPISPNMHQMCYKSYGRLLPAFHQMLTVKQPIIGLLHTSGYFPLFGRGCVHTIFIEPWCIV
jgi:hypothetical protein